MAPPVNISFATATDLGALPVTVTQTADEAGTTYPLYFKFTADGIETGAFGVGDLASYNVITRPYNISEVQLIAGGSGIQATNRPIQFPTTIGDVYYVVCSQTAGNPSPAELTLIVQTAPVSTVPVGSFAVPDDTVGFPLALLSGTGDYTALRYVSPFPSGEEADVLDDGTVLTQDEEDNSVHLYNASYQEISAHTFSNASTIRTCQGTQHFLILEFSNPLKAYTMTAAGVLSSAESITGSIFSSKGALSNDEGLLYHARGGNNHPVEVWNMVSHAAEADLAAAFDASHKVTDILVLGDDTIVVGYDKTTVTRDYTVVRYDTDGTTLNTYVMDLPNAQTSPRLAYAIDDPLSFWVGNHPASAFGSWQFQNVRVSDGMILTTRYQAEFETGAYQAAQSATPLAYFGASFSCPFWITRSSATPTTTTYTIRRQRRGLLPSSDDNKRMVIPILEQLMRTGIGLLPDATGSATPYGVDPDVRLRISKDGGKAWSPERAVSAGTRGNYKDRVRWLQATGNYRNGVFEITTDAPVDFQMLSLEGEPVEGSS